MIKETFNKPKAENCKVTIEFHSNEPNIVYETREVSRNTYYRIISRDGEIRNYDHLEDCMLFLPSSFKRINLPITKEDLTKRNFWFFEKLEQSIFDDGSDDVDVLEECYYVSRHKSKR